MHAGHANGASADQLKQQCDSAIVRKGHLRSFSLDMARWPGFSRRMFWNRSSAPEGLREDVAAATAPLPTNYGSGARRFPYPGVMCDFHEASLFCWSLRDCAPVIACAGLVREIPSVNGY